ncbi:hypothetical protein [Flaviaesturariibacter amylovorans]
MDNKREQHEDTDIGCYRLRSERRRKRDRIGAIEKQLRSLDKRRWELNAQRRALPFIPLEPPVQKGWIRYFVVRDDVARSDKGAFYEGLLAKLNTRDWSYRKDFRVRGRCHGKKVYLVKDQSLREWHEWEFFRQGFTDAEARCFYAEDRYDRHSGRLYRVFVFSEPWRYVLQVRPNIIDKVRLTDPELESEEQRLENNIFRNALDRQIQKVLDGAVYRWRDYAPKPWEGHPYKHWPTGRILDRIKEESE